MSKLAAGGDRVTQASTITAKMGRVRAGLSSRAVSK